jgi:hypothetical protein
MYPGTTQTTDTGNNYSYITFTFIERINNLFGLNDYRMEGELMRIAMEPLLYEYGVDVVLGNVHCSRT